MLKRTRRPVSRQLEVNPCQDVVGEAVYEDPVSCNHFYKCSNGTLTHESCENGLLFDVEMALSDAVYNFCVYNWRVECGERERDDTPISSPGCEYRFGIFPIGDGCLQSYNQCAFGQPTQTACEEENVNIPTHLMLSYDPPAHRCNWPDQLTHLGCDPERMFGFTCPSLQELERTINEQFSPFPRFAVDEAASVYLICVDNLPRLQSCGSLDIFSPDTLQCSRARQIFG